MITFLSKSCFKLYFIAMASVILSACVSQEYNADNTPVVTNEANKQEIAMTRIQLGLGYLKIGNTTQAKLNLEKARRQAPNLVQVYTAFAHYYATVGETELTIQSYKKALSLKSDDADTLNNYGVFLCDQGHAKEAEKNFLKAIAVPSYLLVSQSYENIALCELKNNFFDKAEQYLAKAIVHDPSNAAALIQMAQLQYAKNNDQNAEIYINRYEKSTRHFTPGPLALAYKVYNREGKQRKAKGYASMLVKMFPHSSLAKQYILTGLSHIEADTLAARYERTRLKNEPKIVYQKKRIIRLSPHKPATKTATTKQVILSQVVKSPLVEYPKASKQTEATKQNIVVAIEKPIKVVTNNKKLIDNTDTPNNTVAAMASKTIIDTKTTDNINEQQNIEVNSQKKTEMPVYVVEEGDNLFFISKKYNIRMATLKRWNHLKGRVVLHTGDVIVLADPVTGIAP